MPSRSWTSVLCSQAGLLAAVVVYVFMGMLLFHYLEAGPEQQRQARVKASRDDCLRELWIITERLNVLYERNWTQLVHAQLQRFERAVVAGARADREPQWGLPGSLLYALTLVTTVGWGSAAPRTAAGKAAGMLYALLGAPLLLMWLAAAGGLLAKAARRVVGRCKTQHRHKHHQMDNHFQLHEQQRALLSTPGSARSACPTPAHAACPSPSPAHAHAHQHAHIVHAHGARYSHVFQRAATSPVPGRGGTLQRGRQTPHNASLEGLDDSQHAQTATTSASGTPRRCCLAAAAAIGVAAAAADGTRSGSFTSRGRPEEASQGEETDDSDGECNCTHDTPSRVPLIWRQQTTNPQKDPPRCSTPGSNGPRTPHPNPLTNTSTASIPAALLLLLLSAYLGLGAVIFSAWEGWSFLDSIYFCFITVSTIGFGDFAPGQSVSKLNSSSSRNEYLHLFACCAYLVFGLVLVAMCFSLVQEEVMAKCSQVANSLGLVRH